MRENEHPPAAEGGADRLDVVLALLARHGRVKLVRRGKILGLLIEEGDDEDMMRHLDDDLWGEESVWFDVADAS